MNTLDRNRKYSREYVQDTKIGNIPNLIEKIIEKTEKIVDLGCGYGNLLRGIRKKYSKKNLAGIDISPKRVRFVKNKIPEGKIFCGDVCKTKLKNNSFDLVISTQVIEHLESDREIANEIFRITKKEGYVYVTSVIKKPWAIYKYRNKGKFVLDPTHEKEYKNEKEFLDLFKKKFKLIKFKVFPVRRKLLLLNIRIPGYYIVEGVWQKK